jgi:hypothetical protein
MGFSLSGADCDWGLRNNQRYLNPTEYFALFRVPMHGDRFSLPWETASQSIVNSSTELVEGLQAYYAQSLKEEDASSITFSSSIPRRFGGFSISQLPLSAITASAPPSRGSAGKRAARRRIPDALLQ